MNEMQEKQIDAVRQKHRLWWLRFDRFPSLIRDLATERDRLKRDGEQSGEAFRKEQERNALLQKLQDDARTGTSEALEKLHIADAQTAQLAQSLRTAKTEFDHATCAIRDLQTQNASATLEIARLGAELSKKQADETRALLDLERQKDAYDKLRGTIILVERWIHATHRLAAPPLRGLRGLLANGKRLAAILIVLAPICVLAQFPPPLLRGPYTTNTVAWAQTNVISLSTTNSTSKPLTNHYQDGVLTLFGLEAGANITLTHNGSNIVIIGAAGGGDAGGTNARQFGTLILTNLSGTGAVTNVVSLSTTNATSKPITNHFDNGILTIYGLEAGANVTLSMNDSNIVVASTGGGSEVFFNANQFLPSATHTNIRAGALLTNIFIHQSNNTSVSLVVSNNPGSTRNILEVYNTNQNGFKITSNGVMQIRGNSSGDAPVLFIENTGANQTYTIWTNGNGGNGSFIMRTDNAGNAVFSPGQTAGETFFGGPDSGSGIVNFNLVTVGSLWRLVPSAGASGVAAWHGGTLRRGQITNVWDIWGRTNMWLTRTGLFDGIVLTNDIRFLGHNSTSNDVWVCTNTVTGEGEWRSYGLPQLSDVADVFVSAFHGDLFSFDANMERWTNATPNQSQFTPTTFLLTLRDGVTVTNANNIGILHVTNKPGVDRAVRFWNTNGLGYSEFGVVTQAWLPTNKFLFSVTNPVVGEVLEIQSVSYADGVASIIITNAPDNSGGGGGLATNANQFGASVELTIKAGAFLTNMNYFGTGTNNGDIYSQNHLPLENDTYNLGSPDFNWQTNYSRYYRLFDPAGVRWITLSAATLGSDYGLVLPDAQGAAGQVITNNGSGTLGWWTPGGPLGFNENQFSSNGNLVSIKSGALLTNTLFYPSNLTGPATIHLATTAQVTNLTEWRSTNSTISIAISSNANAIVYGRLDMSNAVAFRTNNIDFRLPVYQAFTNALQTNLVLQLTNVYEGVTHRIDAYGAGRLGNGRTNAWQLLCTVAANRFIYWPPGTTNGNFDVLVNSNQIVSFTFMGGLGSTNILAAYRVLEGIGVN